MVLHLRSKTLKKRQRVRFSKSVTNNARNCPATSESGGEGGIRTPDTLSGMPVFKTGAINHSATSPGLLKSYNRSSFSAGLLSARNDRMFLRPYSTLKTAAATYH